MGPATALASDGVRASGRLKAPSFVFGWLLAVAVLVTGYGAQAMRQEFVEPDNAMRLVEVRDFIAGQAWYDVAQPRLDPPKGTPMHWARWIDAAIAAPMVALRPLLGPTGAEIAVGFVWPLGLLAVFLLLNATICSELGAREGLRTETAWAGSLLAALAFPTLDKFAPGGFDHHNVELICVFCAVLGLIRMDRSPIWAAAAGGALGVMLATAAEGAPLVAAGVGAAGMLWLVEPSKRRAQLAAFGAGLAAASLAMFFLLVPASRWGQPVCDAMSTSFLGFSLSAGSVALALASWRDGPLRSSLTGRLGVAVVLAAAAVGGLWLLFPDCAGGGYSAVSASMKSLWMVQISEARPFIVLAADNPAQALAVGGSAFAGLVAAAVSLWRRPHAYERWILAGFLAASWALMIWQIRGAYFATAFAVPFGAWATMRVRAAWRRSPSSSGLAAFVATAASSAAALWGAIGLEVEAKIAPAAVAELTQGQTSAAACLKPEAFSALKQLRPGTMFNDFMLGADLLQWTAHGAVAGPYHRDAEGTMAVINALRSDPDVARGIIAKTGSDYVLVCSALPEMTFYIDHPANGVPRNQTLAARLNAGEPPAWLTPVPLAGTPLRLYRIQR